MGFVLLIYDDIPNMKVMDKNSNVSSYLLLMSIESPKRRVKYIVTDIKL